MIFGLTHNERRLKNPSPRIGDIREVFAFLPTQLMNGEWVWLQRYTQTLSTDGFSSSWSRRNAVN